MHNRYLDENVNYCWSIIFNFSTLTENEWGIWYFTVLEILNLSTFEYSSVLLLKKSHDGLKGLAYMHVNCYLQFICMWLCFHLPVVVMATFKSMLATGAAKFWSGDILFHLFFSPRHTDTLAHIFCWRATKRCRGLATRSTRI